MHSTQLYVAVCVNVHLSYGNDSTKDIWLEYNVTYLEVSSLPDTLQFIANIKRIRRVGDNLERRTEV